MRFKYIIYAFLVITCVACPVGDAHAQRPRRPRKGEVTAFGSQVAKKKVILPDSLELARRDSVRLADSLFRADSAALQSKSSLEKPAFSAAKDSIVEVFSDGKRIIKYYGEVTVQYEDMKLSAERMEYDMSTGTVHAYGVYDSLAGEWKGRPEMTQGEQSFQMDDLKYNFTSKKARITNMVTTDDQGILHGQNIKMMPDNSVNITDGKYTVCDAEHPHYYMKMSAARRVNGKNEKTVFGPSHVVIEDVKIPFVGIPFGFVPKRPNRATGILMPTFGEEEARGFYMKDLGMYFVFGDFFDLSLTGDYYTLGSWAINANSRYKVNYKFNGNFSINYSYDQTGEKGSPDFNTSANFGVRWSHQMDSKARPGTSFSASVNFSSPQNSKYNSRSVTEALQNQISSSISFSKNFNGKMNLSVSALHSQNSRDSSYAFTFPNVTFSVSTFYPFKRKNRVGEEKWYERFSLGYNTSIQNKINFKASEFRQPGFIDKFQNGMNHNFSIGLPNFMLFNYINLTPSISYGMNWFFRKTDYRYNPEIDDLEKVDSGQFKHFGVTQSYSGSLNMGTRLYGMFNFGKHRKVQAIRHVVSPSITMSFSPELGTYANGWRNLKYKDVSGKLQEYEYNIYANQVNSYPGKGRSATASISIDNNLEAKIRDYADTTGKGYKKIKLIDNLNIKTGYNFLADSCRMNTVSMSMSTSVFGKLGLSGSANFDPYGVDTYGKRCRNFALTLGQGLLRLTDASLSMSYSFSGKGTMNGNDGRNSKSGGQSSGNPADFYQRIYYHPVTGEYIPGGWLYYTNPNVPWSVTLSYSFRYTRGYRYDQTLKRLLNDGKITQTLSASGNIKLSPKLSLNATTGFDVQALKITTTQLSATYDLHCFNISVSWVPTGQWQSYSFRIAANASALADLLKYDKSSSYRDNGNW